MKKICVITGSRSEYGLLKSLIKKIKKSKKLSLQLLVTGSHMSKEFGNTINEIENDNFIITKKFHIFKTIKNEKNIANAMSVAISNFSKIYSKLNPDLILILGDRYEIFSSVIAALFYKIPVAHLHGGERSEGAYDELMRHAITKLSHLHFVSTKIYKKRVIQLGENPNNVYFTGSIGVSNIKKLKFYNKKKLEKILKVSFKEKNLFIIFHPVTLEDKTHKHQMLQIAESLKRYPCYAKFFIYPSADLGGFEIVKIINNFVKNNPNSYCFPSLNQLMYFSLVKNCDMVLGNSSSGIIEVPSLKIGVINIGDRQKGRLKSEAIIDCPPITKNIESSIKLILSKKYQKKIKKTANPYDNGDAANKIISILEKIKLDKLIKKSFFDI